jgi:hypothetical protein
LVFDWLFWSTFRMLRTCRWALLSVVPWALPLFDPLWLDGLAVLAGTPTTAAS